MAKTQAATPDEVIDAVAVEEPITDEHDLPGTALAAPRPPGRDVLMPMEATQVIEGMKAYQKLLQDLLEDSDWQGTGTDKFLKKSGWRKIARAFNLSVTRVSRTIERDVNGSPVRAEAVYRATAPNGQVQDGDGYCSVDEPRFTSAKGRTKLENDLRATATTRAKNRAISDLVGMGEVSAEEVDAGHEEAAPPGLPFGKALKDEDKKLILAATAELLEHGDGPNEKAALRVLNAIKGAADGYVPYIAAFALVTAAEVLKDTAPKPPSTGA